MLSTDTILQQEVQTAAVAEGRQNSLNEFISLEEMEAVLPAHPQEGADDRPRIQLDLPAMETFPLSESSEEEEDMPPIRDPYPNLVAPLLQPQFAEPQPPLTQDELNAAPTLITRPAWCAGLNGSRQIALAGFQYAGVTLPINPYNSVGRQIQMPIIIMDHTGAIYGTQFCQSPDYVQTKEGLTDTAFATRKVLDFIDGSPDIPGVPRAYLGPSEPYVIPTWTLDGIELDELDDEVGIDSFVNDLVLYSNSAQHTVSKGVFKTVEERPQVAFEKETFDRPVLTRGLYGPNQPGVQACPTRFVGDELTFATDYLVRYFPYTDRDGALRLSGDFAYFTTDWTVGMGAGGRVFKALVIYFCSHMPRDLVIKLPTKMDTGVDYPGLTPLLRAGAPSNEAPGGWARPQYPVRLIRMERIEIPSSCSILTGAYNVGMRAMAFQGYILPGYNTYIEKGVMGFRVVPDFRPEVIPDVKSLSFQMTMNPSWIGLSGIQVLYTTTTGGLIEEDDEAPAIDPANRNVLFEDGAAAYV
jgi:hypothetical protein